jgi:putative FmdB family regulatory protein
MKKCVVKLAQQLVCIGVHSWLKIVLDGLNCNLFDADLPASLSSTDRFLLLMPTYEYSCQKCGQNFEAFQSMRDEPFRECPKELCRLPKWGHGKVKRLLGTGAGLIFKGSGFYTTDYRSDSYKEAAKKEAPSTKSDTAEKSAGSKEPAKAPSQTQTKTPEKKPAKESGG